MLLSILLQVGSDHYIFLEEIAKQGPVVAGLVLAIFYFYKRQQKLEEDLKAANEKLETYIVEDRENLIQIINNNTEALKDNTRIMESLQREISQKI